MAKRTVRKAEREEDHVGVRLLRRLRRRLNTYASSQDRNKQDVLDEAVEEYLTKRKA